jgi:translation initiation factor 1A
MPNAKGGKKFKRGKKTIHETKLIYKDPKEDQEYGKIIRAMGNGRFELDCFDGKTRVGIIAGNMRKRVWINKDDIVLFSKWEFSTDDEKCSIIHKYNIDEVKRLQRENEIPSSIKLEIDSEIFDYGDTDDMITFDYGDPDDISDENISQEEEINLDDI